MPRTIESLSLAGPAGRLEALLEAPEGMPREVALVCHPHPQHGGTMHNKVVYRIARALRKSGAVVLRFNYRGVHHSEGSYAHGEGELDDARAALTYLRGRYPELPVTLAGFSFGSRIVLRLGCETQARRVIAVGFPMAYRPDVKQCGTPLAFVQSTHDEYGSVANLKELFDTLSDPKQLVLVEAEDHFFAGGLDRLEETLVKLG